MRNILLTLPVEAHHRTIATTLVKGNDVVVWAILPSFFPYFTHQLLMESLSSGIKRPMRPDDYVIS